MVKSEYSYYPFYPFGSLQPCRNFNAGDYRFGFNGKENDNEVKGTGNQQDYGMRIYDPRLERFLSVDPLTKSYPMLTPYQFSSSNPIWMIDLDGLEGINHTKKIMDENANEQFVTEVEKNVFISVGKQANSLHYKEADVETVKQDLINEYSGDFTDEAGDPVVFKFNFSTYDADQYTSDDFLTQVASKDMNNWVDAEDGITKYGSEDDGTIEPLNQNDVNIILKSIPTKK